MVSKWAKNYVHLFLSPCKQVNFPSPSDVGVQYFLFLFQIGDLGLAVSSATSIRMAGVAGTPSHIPPEASASTTTEPDEAWDVFT